MPVTIKTAAMKYKNSGGTYVGIDAVAETTTSQQVTAINNAGAAQVAAVQAQGATTIASIPQDYTTLSNNVSDLQSASGEHSDIITADLMGIDVQQNLYPGAADWSGEWIRNNATTFLIDDTITFDGYPVVKDAVAWHSIKKDIPVESGKTYTFQVYVKAADASDLRIYIDSPNNPATTSETSKQYTGTPNNVWTKIAFPFSCTASGNVRPCILSVKNGDFYIAKYSLVEGNKVFSLTDALDSKIGAEEISGVGDYLRYDFSLGTSLGQWWNPIINKAYSAGTKCKLIFDSYTGQYLNYVRVDGRKADGTFTIGLCQIDNPVRGGSAEFITTEAYTGFRVQHYRTTDESNVASVIYFATDKELGLSYDNLHTFSQRVYHVEKNGSGDFTSLVEAVNTACQSMDSIVYVGAGTWDIVSELGETYLNGVSSSQRGLYLKNRVHIICSSEALITCNYTGTRADTITWLSAFNAGEYGFTLENARIESSKCRYAIHDERGTAEDAYTNRYLNCNIKHDNTNGGYTQCIGGGLGKDGHIVVSGCVFENPNASNGDIVSYHNTWYAGGTGKSNVEVTGCYFKGTTTFRASWFGASQEISEFIVHDNSVGYPIIHRAENQSMMDDNPTWIQNTELLEWNNVVRD